MKQSDISKKMGNFDHSKISYSNKVVLDRIKANDEQTKKALKYVNNLISNINK